MACRASINSEWEPSKFLEISQRISPEIPNEIRKDGKMGQHSASELAGKLQVKDIDDVGSLSDSWINMHRQQLKNQTKYQVSTGQQLKKSHQFGDFFLIFNHLKFGPKIGALATSPPPSGSAKQLVAIQPQHPDQCPATRHERPEQGARRAPKLLGPHGENPGKWLEDVGRGLENGWNEVVGKCVRVLVVEVEKHPDVSQLAVDASQ